MPLSDHIREIARLRAEGLNGKELADRFGVGCSTMSRFLAENSIPSRKPPARETLWRYAQEKGTPLGKGVHWCLTADEFAALHSLAEKWGCDTISEAAAEIVKDHLAEIGLDDNGGGE